MDRRRKVTVALSAVALAWVGAKQFGGGAADAPVAKVVAVQAKPLRMAAGTPLAGYAPEATGQTALADDLPPALPEPADPCAITLEAFGEEGAMIGLTLMAPCRAGARVTLRHGGLNVAMQTLATGSLFTSIPAMEATGAVEAVFDDGVTVAAVAPVPDVAGLRRLAVEWQDADRFALNGFEIGADYGEAGHRTVANGGVIALGDPAVSPAALAEVYTFPDPAASRVTVEAEVTEATCGRELAGRLLLSENGVARATDLALAMPECDTAGGFVVLNNPLPETTLAAAE